MCYKEDIKKLLEPHYGHLNFLMKIKKEEISIEDISTLMNFIKNKDLVSNLPKELHNYNSYYTLVKDLYITNENLFLIKIIKKNLSPEPKRILLDLIDDRDIASKLKVIFKDKGMKSIFLRWSSRIKEGYSTEYIDSILNDYKVWSEIENEPSRLIELTDFDRHSKYIPSAWCIKRTRTFYQYLRTQRIFIFKYKRRVYGINVYKNTNTQFNIFGDPVYSLSGDFNIIDEKNSTVFRRDNEELYSEVKSELIKYNLFGSKNIIENTFPNNNINNLPENKNFFQKLINRIKSKYQAPVDFEQRVVHMNANHRVNGGGF